MHRGKPPGTMYFDVPYSNRLITHCLDQWRIYIEAKEAVLGAPGLKGPPNLQQKKWLRNNYNTERV